MQCKEQLLRVCQDNCKLLAMPDAHLRAELLFNYFVGSYLATAGFMGLYHNTADCAFMQIFKILKRQQLLKALCAVGTRRVSIQYS